MPSWTPWSREGIYLEKGEVVRQSLRDLFRSHGIEPFVPEKERLDIDA